MDTVINNNNIYNTPILSFNDYIYKNSILQGKMWDEEIVDTIVKHIRDDSDFLDIGANIGLISLGILHKMKEKPTKLSTIHCFECNPFTFTLLSSNVGKYPNIQLYPFALGDKQQLCNSMMNTWNQGCNYIYQTNDLSGNTVYDYTSVRHRSIYENEVPSMFLLSIPLDSMLYQFRKRISVIKIDIEGFEIQALKGAENLIQIHRPVIIVEIWKINLESVITFLASLGYNKYHIINQTNEDYIFYPNETI